MMADPYINSLFQTLLGRAPDPAGMAHYQQQLANDGPQAVYDSINSSPEARNYLLGDGFREAARASTAGINHLPGILSDLGRFANRGNAMPYADPNSIFGGAGQETATNMNALLAGLFGPEAPEEPRADAEPVLTDREKHTKAAADFRADMKRRGIAPRDWGTMWS